MSEPRIARKCPQCGDVRLIPLSERAALEGYFHCSKCGFVEPEREPPPPGGRRDEGDSGENG